MRIILLCLCAVLSGCATSGPTVSKSSLGNLEINVLAIGGKMPPNADLYLDDVFIGNASQHMPVLYAKRGRHIVRVQCPGYGTFDREIAILGDPNHQVLNVVLEPKVGQPPAGATGIPPAQP